MNSKIFKAAIFIFIFVLLVGGFFYLNNKKQNSLDRERRNIVNETNKENIIKDENDKTTISTPNTTPSEGVQGEGVIPDQQIEKINSDFDKKFAELEAREEAGETINWESEMDKIANDADKQFSETESQLMSETIEE